MTTSWGFTSRAASVTTHELPPSVDHRHATTLQPLSATSSLTGRHICEVRAPWWYPAETRTPQGTSPMITPPATCAVNCCGVDAGDAAVVCTTTLHAASECHHTDVAFIQHGSSSTLQPHQHAGSTAASTGASQHAYPTRRRRQTHTHIWYALYGGLCHCIHMHFCLCIWFWSTHPAQVMASSGCRDADVFRRVFTLPSSATSTCTVRSNCSTHFRNMPNIGVAAVSQVCTSVKVRYHVFSQVTNPRNSNQFHSHTASVRCACWPMMIQRPKAPASLPARARGSSTIRSCMSANTSCASTPAPKCVAAALSARAQSAGRMALEAGFCPPSSSRMMSPRAHASICVPSGAWTCHWNAARCSGAMQAGVPLCGTR